MKFKSPLFDRIRVKPGDDRLRDAAAPRCDWTDCAASATHRAPKGRTRENEYWRFCLQHVREYNHGYNFFAGMSDDAVAHYLKDAVTGHRPTWKMGMTTGRNRSARRRSQPFGADAAQDPFGMFREFGARAGAGDGAAERADGTTRTIRNAERKALQTLGLEVDAVRAEIKARFKLLVKRHHPDANGGDRASEDKLREILQAYNYLKSVGFC
ncbi:MAG: DnaJ domain-containing protein [Proteobacteria bacterium]|nr:DnaJ domain-containing protein [Pseudomonadota bacterium]